MTEFITTAGIKIPIQPISLADLQLAQNAIEQQFRDSDKQVDPPTYEVKLELEGTSTYHPHTEVTIQEGTLEEKEAWQRYLDTQDEMQNETQSRTALIFLEGIIFDLPEDDSWIARRKKLFNEDVPEDEDEKKLHYVNNVLLKTPADKQNLMLDIQLLSMTGATDEAVTAYEELFRSQMEIQGREATKVLKAELERQKELVLQPTDEGRDSSQSEGDDKAAIQTVADGRSGGNDSVGKHIIKDDRVGKLPRSIKSRNRQDKEQT